MTYITPMEYCYRVREMEGGRYRVHRMFPPPEVGIIGWARDYPNYDSLPLVLREKISMLKIINTDDHVKGVGHLHFSVPPTYWVYTDKDVYGDDT